MQDIESILKPLPINDELKAQAWDAFQESRNQDELADRLQRIGIPQEIKAQLWDMKTPAEAAAPPKSRMEQILGLVQQGRQGVNDAAVGALQGVGQMIHGGGQMVRSIPGIGPLLASGPEVQIGGNLSLGDLVAGQSASGMPDILQPKNTAQQIGKTGSDIASFFLPETAIGKLAGGSKFARGALDALSAAGITGAQGGDPKSAAALSGVLSGVAPGMKIATDKLPAMFVNYFLRPAERAFDFGKNPGQAIAEEGIVAPTVGRLVDKLKTVKAGIFTQLEASLKAAGDKAQIKIADAITPIEEAIQDAANKNNKKLISKLQEFRYFVTNKLKADAEGKIISTGARDSASAYEATLLKRDIGESTEWSGKAYQNVLNKVKAQVYRNLDAAIDEVAPMSKEFNRRYANALSAQKAAERLKGMSDFKMSDLILAVTGGGLASQTAHGIPGMAALMGAKKVAETTAGATSVAQLIRNAPRMAAATKASLLTALSGTTNKGATR